MLDPKDIPAVVEYINNRKPVNLITFHGGEPLKFSKNIDIIIDTLNDKTDTYFLQTNGSLILDNKDFFIKHKEQIFVSISYDFCTQKKNRREFDISETLSFLKELGIKVQLQSVIEMNSNFFEEENILDIINTYKKYNIAQLDFITLRDLRDKNTLRVILDEYTQEEILSYIQKVMKSLITFKQFDINVYIDGAPEALEENKKYSHKDTAFLNIISPNGKVYTEFDFLDYDHDDFAVDVWKQGTVIQPKNVGLKESCENCSQKKICGLKYLVALFDKPIPKNCELFYSNINIVHLWGKYLKNVDLLQPLGLDFENFINSRL